MKKFLIIAILLLGLNAQASIHNWKPMTTSTYEDYVTQFLEQMKKIPGYVFKSEKKPEKIPSVQKQTETILRELPYRANNWLAIQGKDKWIGLSKDQLHHKLLTFDNPELGVRASIVSLISRAVRKNKSPKLSINQIFFEEDPWAEKKENYAEVFKKLGISYDTQYDVLDRKSITPLVNTMALTEMGAEDYNSISKKERDRIINEGIDMAYEYVSNPEYTHYGILYGE